MTTTNEPFASWAVLELMGHRQLVGYLQEVEIAGGKMFRIDVPESNGQGAYSQFYGTGAVYCVSPVTEDVAKALIGRKKQEPFYAYALPSALPAPERPEPAPQALHDDLDDETAVSDDEPF